MKKVWKIVWLSLLGSLLGFWIATFVGMTCPYNAPPAVLATVLVFECAVTLLSCIGLIVGLTGIATLWGIEWYR